MSDMKTSLTETAAQIRTLGTANGTGAISTAAALNFLRDNAQLFQFGKVILVLYLFGILMFVGAFICNGSAITDAEFSKASEKERAEWPQILWLVPKEPEAYLAQVRRNGRLSILFAGASGFCFLGGLLCTIWAVLRFL